ncbi:DUF4304 domain-containing protein [Adhaeribacter swui]|uniref:DUF4304 domain-containing protein n=1 Tax=Adhaeribacter swui TaxID=2086471 RepID=A0A7G7GEL4_9BACT|nr:DUF4304 domain-containing protein [Adhaeribacter swui]QNF35598.1 DUF4304 domain-containing protein [Adhaeribacter swui]
MPKSDSEQIFDFLVAKIIWPKFKERGYKKSVNNFRFYDQSGWGKIVNFQKSSFYDKDNIQFTINTGLYLAEAEQFHCNRQSAEKFQESMCLVRKRIGYLSDDQKDTWFSINIDTDKQVLFNNVERYFNDYILPFLDKVRNKEDILQILINGHKSEYKTAQIQTLHHNGYFELANQQLQDELRSTNNPYLIKRPQRD